MALSTSSSASVSKPEFSPMAHGLVDVTSASSSNAVEKADAPIDSDIVLVPMCTVSQKKDLDVPVDSDIVLVPMCTIA